VLEQTVDDALSDFPQHGRDRNRLIAHLIRALESDANWVELYGITGELKVPAFDDDSGAKEILFRIREVGYSITPRRDRHLSFRRCWQGSGLQV
jgi:trafficking protein particle complex subunit 10